MTALNAAIDSFGATAMEIKTQRDQLLAALRLSRLAMSRSNHASWCAQGAEPECGCSCGLTEACLLSDIAIRAAEGADHA